MNERGQRRRRLRALRFYTLLVRLYPKAHKESFGLQMQQTFIDHYRDTEGSHGRVGIAFWLGVLGDAAWSIGREHLAAVHSTVGRWELWSYVPSGLILSGALVAAIAGDRRALVCCTLGAALVFALTRPAAIVPKLLTELSALGVVLAGILLAVVTGQWRDLFNPLLLLVTMLFVARTASGIWARLRGKRQPLRSREELLWGILVAALLQVSYGIAALPPEDTWVWLAVLLGLGSATLCGGAAVRTSRASGSIEAGFFASVAALAIGLMLWLISLPLVIVLITWIMGSTILGLHSMPPSALPLQETSAFWAQNLRVAPRYLPALLCMGVAGGYMGAICGFSLIDEETHRVMPPAVGDARLYGTCAGCGAQSWERTVTCWCCGRNLVV